MNISCTAAHDTKDLFFNNFNEEGVQGYKPRIGQLSDNLVKTGITFHSNKNPIHQFETFSQIKRKQIEELKDKINKLKFEIEKNETSMSTSSLNSFVKENSKRGVIWKSMSNWHLYSNNPIELNRRVRPPWSNYFTDLFSRATKKLIENENIEIQRVSIPNFYFSNIAQKSVIDIVTKHKISRKTKKITKQTLTKIVFDRTEMKELKPMEIRAGSRAEVVHFIVPLSRRNSSLRRFIEIWKKTLKIENRIHLTLSIMDSDIERIKNTKQIIENELESELGNSVEIIEEISDFSRGPALQSALNNRNEKDLIFFCDIGILLILLPVFYFIASGYNEVPTDLIFDSSFIKRIRLLTAFNTVYFPIFFSQYQLSPSGFWRWFSFGMVAFYKGKHYSH